MKYLLIPLIASLAIGPTRAAERKAPTDKKEKTSYSMGYNIGNAWKRQGIEPADVDLDVLLQGLRDATAGTESLVPEQENRELLTGFQSELRTRRDEKRKQLGEKNKKEGETFLAENKTKPDVQTLPSGLQYKVLTQGTGPKPTTNDTVSVHYRGTLIDGTEFDSSYKNGKPTSLKVTGVIKGWTEALQLMNVGAKWQLFIPSELAYGERGAGMNIGPHAVLLFDIELVSIQPTENASAGAQQQPVTSDIIKVPSAEEIAKGAKIEIIKADQLEKEKQKEMEKEKEREKQKR